MICNPILYRYLSATTSSLATLPLDIAQTKILSTTSTNININEIQFILLAPLIFTSQNLIYSELSNVKNILVRGALAGFLSSPIYSFIEIRKIHTRLNILPHCNTYIKIFLLRQTIFYAILYKITSLNIKYSIFLSALIANTIGYPIKLLALASSYSVFKINKNTVRLTGLIEIIKASISDGLSIYFMYVPSFSPFNL